MAGGRRQKAEGRWQKAEGRRRLRLVRAKSGDQSPHFKSAPPFLVNERPFRLGVPKSKGAPTEGRPYTLTVPQAVSRRVVY